MLPPDTYLAATAQLETADGQTLHFSCYKRSGKYQWGGTQAHLTRSMAAAENALADYLAQQYSCRSLTFNWIKAKP